MLRRFFTVNEFETKPKAPEHQRSPKPDGSGKIGLIATLSVVTTAGGMKP